MKKLSCSLFLCFGLAQQTIAGTSGTLEQPKSFYINAGIGAVFSNTASNFISDSNAILYSPTSIGTSLFSLPNVDWHNQFKNGYDINLLLGTYFKKTWRGEVEFLYQNIERDTDGSYDWLEQNSITGIPYAHQNNNPISKIATRADIYSFLSSVGYDFALFNTVQPFLGLGIGVSWLKSGSTQTNNTINIDDPATPLIETAPALQNSPSLTGTAFAWQLKAGINYPLSETSTAIVQYRLFKTTTFQGNKGTIVTNPGINGQTTFYTGQHSIKGLLLHAVELNFRFNL